MKCTIDEVLDKIEDLTEGMFSHSKREFLRQCIENVIAEKEWKTELGLIDSMCLDIVDSNQDDKPTP